MLKLISQNNTTSLTLADVKKHLNVEHSEDDGYITSLMSRAVDLIERESNIDLRATTWEEQFYFFPNRITLVRSPLTSITSVKYIDTEGTLQTLSSNDYYAIMPTKTRGYVESSSFPSVFYNRPDSVQVRYVAGYTTLPPIAEQCICLAVGTWFNQREDETEARLQTLGLGFQRLLDQLSQVGVY